MKNLSMIIFRLTNATKGLGTDFSTTASITKASTITRTLETSKHLLKLDSTLNSPATTSDPANGSQSTTLTTGTSDNR